MTGSQGPNRAELIAGSFWKGGSAAIRTVLSIATQVVLGFLLVSEDFGIYALAIGVANLVQVFRDGGVRLITTRMRPDKISDLHGRLTRYSLAASLAVAPIVLAAGLVASRFYGEPDVFRLVLILAVAIPLGFYAPLGFGVLHAELQFRRAATIEVVSAGLRQMAIVVLALLGFGPFSFVLPVVGVNLFESVATRWVVGRRGSPEPTGRLFEAVSVGQFAWATAGGWLGTISQSVPYLVLGGLVSVSTLGYVFFAYQIVTRLMFVIGSARNVAMPAFAQRGLTAENLGQAVVIAAALGGFITVGLALTGPDILTVIWGSKWAPSIGALVAFAFMLPFNTSSEMAEHATVAVGRFGLWSGQLAVRIVGLAAGATIGGLTLPEDPTLAAIWITAGAVVSSLAVMWWTNHEFDTGSPKQRWAVGVLSPLVLLGTAVLLTLKAALSAIGWSGLAVGVLLTIALVASILRVSPQVRQTMRGLNPKRVFV